MPPSSPTPSNGHSTALIASQSSAHWPGRRGSRVSDTTPGLVTAAGLATWRRRPKSGSGDESRRGLGMGLTATPARRKRPKMRKNKRLGSNSTPIKAVHAVMNSSSSSIPISSIDIDEDTSLRSSPTAPSQRLPPINNVSHRSNRMPSSDADPFDETPSTPTAPSKAVSVHDDSVWSEVVPLNDLTGSPDETLGRIRPLDAIILPLPPLEETATTSTPLNSESARARFRLHLPDVRISHREVETDSLSTWRDPYGFHKVEAHLRIRQPRPASPTSSTSSLSMWLGGSPPLSDPTASSETSSSAGDLRDQQQRRSPGHRSIATQPRAAWKGGQMLARILDPRANSQKESAPPQAKESRTRSKRVTQEGQERRQEGARGVKKRKKNVC